MIKDKRYYANQIIDGLQNRYPNIDFKIDERDVFIVLDNVVNQFAEQNYFDNWKMMRGGVDDQFITTFTVTVIDPDNDAEEKSYFIIPANYAALPDNGGIVEIYPLSYEDDALHLVVVMSSSDYRRSINNPAIGLQGRLGGFPKGDRFIFTKHSVAAKYETEFECRLVVKDSSAIALGAHYPIPSNYENLVIETCIEKFQEKRTSPTDTVRDGNDNGTPQNQGFGRAQNVNYGG